MKLNIKDKLIAKNMSRYALAKRIDVSYPTITSIYNGVPTSIKFEILEALCRELNCTPNDIFVAEDPKVKQLLSYYEEMNKHIEERGTT